MDAQSQPSEEQKNLQPPLGPEGQKIEETREDLQSTIADEAVDRLDKIEKGEAVPGVQATLWHQKAAKPAAAPVVQTPEATPEPIVLNAEKIANKLKEVFGDELKLTEQELKSLDQSYSANKDVIHQQKMWPELEQMLERKKVEENPNLNVQETEGKIITALAA
jgi:hypothetical protein